MEPEENNEPLTDFERRSAAQEARQAQKTVYYNDMEDGTADHSKDTSRASLRKRIIMLSAAFVATAALFFTISVVLINVFNVSYIKVSGNSMQPTFNTNDGVFITTTDDDPQRDDIVVFVTPQSWLDYAGDFFNEPRYFVKRAVGVPGDEIQFSPKGVSVNGEQVFANDAGIISCERSMETGILADDAYLLLGDNNNFSTDAYRLYCVGAGISDVVVGREMIHYHGDDLFIIDGGWSWFEDEAELGQYAP